MKSRRFSGATEGTHWKMVEVLPSRTWEARSNRQKSERLDSRFWVLFFILFFFFLLERDGKRNKLKSSFWIVGYFSVLRRALDETVVRKRSAGPTPKRRASGRLEERKKK